MRIDGETPDTEYEESVGDARIAKLNQRVTIITILIPCLFGALLFFAYLNMKKDVDTTFSSEAEEVQKISEALESRFSELSAQSKALEDRFVERIDAVNKTITDLKGKVDKNRKRAATNRANNANKASKKTVSLSVAKIDASIAALQQDLAALLTEIKDLDSARKGELGRFSDALGVQRGASDSLRKELTDLSATQIDREELDAFLDDRQKSYQQNLDQVEQMLRAKLLAVQKKMSKLERTLLKTETSSRPIPKKVTSHVPATAPKPIPKPVEPSAEPPAVPESGTITEQDIH